MNREARLRYILKELDKKGTPSVRELIDALGVSHMTVHRDLSALEHQGLLIRKHGIVVKSEAFSNLFSFSRKLQVRREEKRAIGERAVAAVVPGDTIFIDHGSTLFIMSELLEKVAPLRIITNSLPIASELMKHAGIHIVLAGGEVINERQACYGSLTERALSELKADKAFVGADGVSLEEGITSYDDKLGEVIRVMIKNAKQTYLLADSSKLEKVAYHRILPLSAVSCLVTDDAAPAPWLRRCRARGLEVQVAKLAASHHKRSLKRA
jgi:DeoR family fructose operon transcriptional repressor